MSFVNHERDVNGNTGKMGAVNADVALQKEAFVKLLTKFIRYETLISDSMDHTDHYEFNVQEYIEECRNMD